MRTIGWCLEHENPAPVPDADHCPYPYWLELNHGPVLAAEAADSCRVIPGRLFL